MIGYEIIILFLMEDKFVLEETLIGDKEYDAQEQSTRTASVSSSVYNLINGILGWSFTGNSLQGSGILVLPMSISKFGYVAGCMFLLLFASSIFSPP